MARKRKLCNWFWMPVREGNIAVMKSGARYEIRKDGWRRVA